MAKLALVTGASRGIGEAILGNLKAAGYEVLAPTRSEVDLASDASVRRFCSSIKNQSIQILVNNAGINHLASIQDVTGGAWTEMVQINLTAPMLLAQAVMPGMIEKKWGRIVNVTSVFSQVTKEKRSMYSATKSGLNGLTRTLAVEGAPYNVLVNSLAPGYVETELTRKNNSPADLEIIKNTIPMKRLAAPSEMANVVRFLVSEENTYLTGQIITVDGGFSLR